MSAIIFLALRITLVVCLYAFLGWVLYTLWQGIHQQGLLLAARKVPPISLVIQSKGLPPASLWFSQAEIIVGRDPGCEVPVADETMSARHARLHYHHRQWWVEDLNSTNSTRLNDERLVTPTVVISGDRIACGNTTISLQISGDTLASPTRPLQQEDK